MFLFHRLGPGSGRSKIQKKYSMKTTTLIGSTSKSEGVNKLAVSADVNQSQRNASDSSSSSAQMKPPRINNKMAPSPVLSQSRSSPQLAHRGPPSQQPQSSPKLSLKGNNQQWEADLTKSKPSPPRNGTSRDRSKSPNNNKQ